MCGTGLNRVVSGKDPVSSAPAMHPDKNASIIEHRGWGGKFYFVLTPDIAEHVYPGLRDAKVENWHERCLAKNIPVHLCNMTNREQIFGRRNALKIASLISDRTIYPLDETASDPDPHSYLPLRMPGHYNGKAYRVIADAILPYLKKDLSE